MTNSPAAGVRPGCRIDEALMRLPLGRWVGMPDVAAHVRETGLPREHLTSVVRTGRRRGVLKTRREPGQDLTYVMRIFDAPARPPAASKTT